MTIIERITKPAIEIDSQATILDAIQDLVVEGKVYAGVKRNGKIVGIINCDNLLNLSSLEGMDISTVTVFSVMEPAFFLNSSEPRAKAAKLMIAKDVEHISVTDEAGNFIGVITSKDVA